MSNLKSLTPSAFTMKMKVFDEGQITPANTSGSFVAFIDAAQGENYLLTFDITSPTANGHHWVTVRHYDQNNKYVVEMISGQVHIEVHKASVVTAGKPVAFPLTAGGEKHCYIQMQGFAFTFGTYDDSSGTRVFTPVVEWTDPTSAFGDGPSIGLYSGGGEINTKWCDIAGTPQ